MDGRTLMRTFVFAVHWVQPVCGTNAGGIATGFVGDVSGPSQFVFFVELTGCVFASFPVCQTPFAQTTTVLRWIAGLRYGHEGKRLLVLRPPPTGRHERSCSTGNFSVNVHSFVAVPQVEGFPLRAPGHILPTSPKQDDHRPALPAPGPSLIALMLLLWGGPPSPTPPTANCRRLKANCRWLQPNCRWFGNWVGPQPPAACGPGGPSVAGAADIFVS